jgi:hypothetical protein
METISHVFSTNDYGLFSYIKGNRAVIPVHVKRLKESFSKKYLLSPIIVNRNFQIIDGQNRFEAAKQIGKPINFIICNDYGLEEVQLLNTNTKNWKRIDYLNAFCDIGNEQYIKFKQFMDDFPDFGFGACEVLLTNFLGKRTKTNSDMKSTTNKDGSYSVRYFEEGDLFIPNYKKSVENANKLLMLKPYYEGYNRFIFVTAMLGVFKIDYYDHNKFISKLHNNPTALQHCPNITQYKLMIEDIYNFRSKEKVSLRF